MKITNPFRMPTVEELRAGALADAKRQLERQQWLVEEHASQVALCQVRIARLEGSVVQLHHPVLKGVAS